MSNELNGSAHNVVQAGTINGPVNIGHECASRWAVYLQAAEALSSAVLLRQRAGIVVLAQLVRTDEAMHRPAWELVGDLDSDQKFQAEWRVFMAMTAYHLEHDPEALDKLVFAVTGAVLEAQLELNEKAEWILRLTER
ncbi:hypothetical protein [Kutzneria chonburiensis]|uniref:Uncharacterized protein n=1 Tax=Kutzneria chonburiensis TaxID=1483604 RepID=A0ABV6N380_9PSEU|nr:hypothetical protein [Kutzneria chonburiensis]